MAGPFYFSIWLVCATLYPAYESFKAVKTKNTKNYVSSNYLFHGVGVDVMSSPGSLDDVLDCICHVFCSGVFHGPNSVFLVSPTCYKYQLFAN